MNWDLIMQRAEKRCDELINVKAKKLKRFQKYKKRVENRNKLYQKLRSLGRV